MIIFIIMISSLFIVYTTSQEIGSISKMFDLLNQAAKDHPIDGNAGGSYLTMNSVLGGYTGLVFIGSGFSASVDSQLSQKAIAADPTQTLPGYLLGGSCWFTIPFVLASTYGLAAAATEALPSFPTYPNRMNSYEVSSGKCNASNENMEVVEYRLTLSRYGHALRRPRSLGQRWRSRHPADDLHGRHQRL